MQLPLEMQATEERTFNTASLAACSTALELRYHASIANTDFQCCALPNVRHGSSGSR